MDLRRLEIFLILMETQSFSKTASILGLTQPSISTSLKTLEDSLGVQLFERSPSKVTPLKLAEILQPYAQNIMETMAQALWAIAKNSSKEELNLKIGASTVPMNAILPLALKKFKKLYPKVGIIVKNSTSEKIVNAVLKEELNFALVGYKPNNNDVIAHKIKEDSLVLLSSQELLKTQNNPPKNVEDLLKWPLILREDGSATNKAFLLAIEKESLLKNLNIYGQVEGLNACLALVNYGLGATVISKLIVNNLNENLISLPLEFLNIKRSFYLIYKKNYVMSKTCKKLMDIILKD